MLGVIVDDIVMVDSEFEVVTEGVEKTSFYEGRRGRFNTWFGLEGLALVFTRYSLQWKEKGDGRGPVPDHRRSPQRQHRAGPLKGGTWGRW